MQERGIQTCVLKTESYRTHAVALYNRLGFQSGKGRNCATLNGEKDEKKIVKYCILKKTKKYIWVLSSIRNSNMNIYALYFFLYVFSVQRSKRFF